MNLLFALNSTESPFYAVATVYVHLPRIFCLCLLLTFLRPERILYTLLTSRVILNVRKASRIECVYISTAVSSTVRFGVNMEENIELASIEEAGHTEW